MKLGIQLYTLRDFVTTPEDLTETILKCKAMGYENVQFSGVPDMGAEIWREVAEKTQVDIVCTHSPFDRIVNDTEALIKEHKIISCPMIGLGNMPKEYRGTLEGANRFFALLEEPVKKIKAAGLKFAYHNHDFDFTPFSDSESCVIEEIIENHPDWSIIADTGWVIFSKVDPIAFLERVGKDRLQCIHFKDFHNDEDRKSICACGEGFSDFSALVKACHRIGVENILVEQDNAGKMPDPFDEVKRSYDHLRPLFDALED